MTNVTNNKFQSSYTFKHNGGTMEFIDQFEKHYEYDCTYMRRMAKSAPKAFETFVNFLPMGQVGASLPPDILWTAKIAAMLTPDTKTFKNKWLLNIVGSN